MHSTRRRYLRCAGGCGAAVLAGLAGCVGGGSGGAGDGTSTPTSTPTPTPTSGPEDTPPDVTDARTCGDGASGTRPAGTGGPGVTLVAVDDCVDLPIRPAVAVVRDAATPDHPPRLRTTLTNTADEPIRVGEGRAAHFEYVRDDSDALVLLPGGDERTYPADPDCWRLTEDIAVTEEYRTFEIEGGGSSSRRVDLYATPGGDACLPVGEHRFETTISVVSEAAEPESSAQWGFSILLE